MRCDEMAERFSELLAGELSERDAQALRAHLAECAGCAEETRAFEALWAGLGRLADHEPPAGAAERFAARLAEEIASERRLAPVVPFARPAHAAQGSAGGRFGRFVPSGAFQALAASLALVAVGVLAGIQLSKKGSDEQIVKLQQDVRSLHETVALALLAESSSAKRLEGVSYSREASLHEDKVAQALFDALSNDPNVNVRLAALDALRPRAVREEERPRLVAAFAAQDSPLVQLSLLSLLLESDSDAARRDLEQLLEQPNLDPVVRGYLRDRLGRRI